MYQLGMHEHKYVRKNLGLTGCKSEPEDVQIQLGFVPCKLSLDLGLANATSLRRV